MRGEGVKAIEEQELSQAEIQRIETFGSSRLRKNTVGRPVFTDLHVWYNRGTPRRIDERDRRDKLIWFIWSIWFNLGQPNKRDKPGNQSGLALRAARSMAASARKINEVGQGRESNPQGSVVRSRQS